MSIAELFNNIKSHNQEFCETFSPLRLSQFHDVFTGFDIVKFDKAIETPDGKSTKDWVIEKYGENAAELILKLIRGWK